MTVIPWRGPSARERAKALHPSNGARATTSAGPAVGGRPLAAALWNEAICRAHLAYASEGKLSCPSFGVHDLPVPCALTRLGVLLVPMATLGELGASLSGRLVALEVCGRAAAGGRWIVRVTGTAVDRMVVPNGPAGLRELGLTPGRSPGNWDAVHGGVTSLAIPIGTIRGYQRTDAEPVAARPRA